MERTCIQAGTMFLGRRFVHLLQRQCNVGQFGEPREQLDVEDAACQAVLHPFIVPGDEVVDLLSARRIEEWNGALHHMQHVENADARFNGLPSPGKTVQPPGVVQLGEHAPAHAMLRVDLPPEDIVQPLKACPG
jgi:hypothetical protein